MIICVEVGGALAVTQHLSAISTGSTTFQGPSSVRNPFAMKNHEANLPYRPSLCTNEDSTGLVVERLANGMAISTMDELVCTNGLADTESEENVNSRQQEEESRTSCSTLFGSGGGGGGIR